jgi:hypothetical protein
VRAQGYFLLPVHILTWTSIGPLLLLLLLLREERLMFYLFMYYALLALCMAYGSIPCVLFTFKKPWRFWDYVAFVILIVVVFLSGTQM